MALRHSGTAAARSLGDPSWLQPALPLQYQKVSLETYMHVTVQNITDQRRTICYAYSSRSALSISSYILIFFHTIGGGASAGRPFRKTVEGAAGAAAAARCTRQGANPSQRHTSLVHIPLSTASTRCARRTTHGGSRSGPARQVSPKARPAAAAAHAAPAPHPLGRRASGGGCLLRQA